MKTIEFLCKKAKEEMKPPKPMICEHVMTPWGPSEIKEPFLADTYTCEYCGGKGHYTPAHDPVLSKRLVWLCENTDCRIYDPRSKVKATNTPPNPKRAILWPLFCEINDIGDIYHDVVFENIEQPVAKVDYLLKFGLKPTGIIVMQGVPGSGKSFASMGVCELYTRRNISAIFATQKQMSDKWLETFKDDIRSNYIEKVTKCNLLVVDDFGTAEVTASFMNFFRDLINTRMQWTDRGTIITTNLDDKSMANYCGLALSDRLGTSQKFTFTQKSRRKPI